MDIAVKLARTLGISLDVLCGMYGGGEGQRVVAPAVA